MFEFLFDELEKTDGSTVLVLDELNNIEDHDLLYQLPRAHSNQRLSQDTRAPCIIGISNDTDYLSNMPPNVADTLNETTIQFAPYNAHHLESILETRAENAIYDNVMKNAVIPLCAAKAANENGSARRALRLLRIAGEITRNEHEDTITAEHVYSAENQLDKELVRETINSGTRQTQQALLSVALAASNKYTPERTSELHDLYENICVSIDTNSLKHDRFRHRLETLSERSIINSKTKNDDGQYSEYTLNKDLTVILDALVDCSYYEVIIERIVKNARDNHLLDSDDLDGTALKGMGVTDTEVDESLMKTNT